MTFDTYHAAFFGESHESVLQVLATFGHNPAVVHYGTVFLAFHGAAEHGVAVDLFVKQSRFLGVDFVHLGHASDGVLNPFQSFVHHEYVDYRRSVEHGDVLGLFGSVCAVVHHGGQGVHVLTVGDFAEDVLANDNESNAGRTYVLLSTTVDKTIFLNVDGTAHDVGAHVGHQHNVVYLVGCEVLADFGTVDGVVGCDVEIVGIGGNCPSFGDVAVGLVLAAGNDNGLAEQFSFFGGFLSPNACLQIGGFFVQEVGGHCHKLSAGTAAEEQYFVFFGDVQKVAPELTGLGHQFFPTGCTVADFGNSDAGVVKVVESLYGVLNCLFRQYAGTCVKVISCFHFVF